MFLLNSCLSLFSAAPLKGLPFSRSYGYILPSSLAMLLPSALGSSPHPPVSVCGTGIYQTIAAFLDGPSMCFATHCSLRVTLSACMGGFLPMRLWRLHRSCHSRHTLRFRVPTVLLAYGAGIYTCCPSATRFRLALGPDFPREDQLYPGYLGYSAWGIPTPISLLIPAFSLHSSPPLLPVWLQPAVNAPLPIIRDDS